MAHLPASDEIKAFDAQLSRTRLGGRLAGSMLITLSATFMILALVQHDHSIPILIALPAFAILGLAILALQAGRPSIRRTRTSTTITSATPHWVALIAVAFAASAMGGLLAAGPFLDAEYAATGRFRNPVAECAYVTFAATALLFGVGMSCGFFRRPRIYLDDTGIAADSFRRTASELWPHIESIELLAASKSIYARTANGSRSLTIYALRHSVTAELLVAEINRVAIANRR